MSQPGSRDYRDLKRADDGSKPPDDRPDQHAARRWWTLKGDKCSMAISDNVDSLQQAQTQRLQRLRSSSVLYGNLGGASFGINTSPLVGGQMQTRNAVTFNAVQSITDTIVSRVGETKPRPYFLTSGGNYKQQRKAKKLNQFVEGVFYECKAYDLGLEAFRDCAIGGDGFVHVFTRANRIAMEVVSASELWLDEEEGKYGKPRNINRAQVVDKDELTGLFPEHREKIMSCDRAPSASKSPDQLSSMVTVITSYHLGQTNEKGELEGGKYAVALPAAGIMLVEPEEWPYDFFPFAHISWSKRPTAQGYWSQGLAEQLAAQQYELNRILALNQRAIHLMGAFKLLIENGSKIVKEHLNNETGAVVTYVGKPPEYVTPNPVPAEYFRYPLQLVDNMRQQAGYTELQTAGAKPSGVTSGVAMRNLEDVSSDRHRTVQRANDNLYLQMAFMSIALARELKGYSVRVPSKSAFNVIDFKKDIGNISDEDFVMQCYPISRLPQDPAGKLETIQDYVQAGFIEQRHAPKLLDFPDLEAFESMRNAQEDVILRNMDSIIDDGEYIGPEPTDDLPQSKVIVLEHIQRYRLLDLEESRLNMLRTYSVQVDELLAEALTPPPGAAMPGQPMTPPAAPMPTPTSDLVPNGAGMARAA